MSDFDWPAIRIRWCAGESGYSISKSLGGKPTSQGIGKRAKKEGWAKAETGLVNLNGNSVSYETYLEQCKDIVPVGDKDCPETRAVILQCIHEGLSLKVAAEYVGIDADTLLRWRKRDTTFAAQIREVQINWQRRQVGKLDNSPDPKWAAYQLERHPATREDYVQRSHAPGDNQFQVVVNIDRGSLITVMFRET